MSFRGKWLAGSRAAWIWFGLIGAGTAWHRLAQRLAQRCANPVCRGLCQRADRGQRWHRRSIRGKWPQAQRKRSRAAPSLCGG